MWDNVKSQKRPLLAFACALVLLLVGLGEPMRPSHMILTLVFFGVPLTAIILSNTGMISETRYLPWSLACALSIGGIYMMTCNPWVRIIGDNIVNIRDAMRLVEGKSLIDTQYGLGFKALLMPPLALFDNSVTAMKVVVASTGVLFPLFGFLVLRRFTSPSRALTIAVLAAVLPVSVDYSAQLNADLPYSSFSLLALYVTLRYVDRPDLSWRWLIGASCAMGWAYHIKDAGLFLAMAAVVYLLVRREMAKAALLAAGVGAWVVPWMLFLKTKVDKGLGHFSAMLAQISRGENIVDEKTGDFWHNLFHLALKKNPQDYLRNLGDVFLPYDFPGEAWLFLALIVVGFIAGRPLMDRKPISILKVAEIHDWYVVGYFVVLFALPASPDRYLIPILPFLVLYLFRGLDAAVGLLREASATKATFVVSAVLLFICSYPSNVAFISLKRSQEGYPGYWENYYRSALWVGDHTPPESRIAARKPSLMWFWSRRESAVFPRTKNKEEALEGLKSSFDYVVVDNLPFFPDKVKYLIPVIEAYPKSFAIVHTTPEPKNYVFKIVPAREGANAGSP